MYYQYCLPILQPLIIYTSFLFFFNDTATTEIYTLSLHDALPICRRARRSPISRPTSRGWAGWSTRCWPSPARTPQDRKSTRLNSSHVRISYAVFCLKKKKKIYHTFIHYNLTIRNQI